MRMNESLIRVPALGTPFLLLDCHVQLGYESLLLYLIYLIIFCFVMIDCYILKAYFLLMRDRKGMDPEGGRGGEELGGLEGGDTVIRIYCIRKEHFQ